MTSGAGFTAWQTRVTCWLAPGRRVILLTVLPRTRRSGTAEVARAVQAQKICEAGHGTAHQVSGREVNWHDRTPLLL